MNPVIGDSGKEGVNGSGSRFAEGAPLGEGGAGSGTGSSRTRSGTGSGTGSGFGIGSGKPKFMDRVKGEAKVFVGKMGGNEEKVEEGRRMMGKSYQYEAIN